MKDGSRVTALFADEIQPSKMSSLARYFLQNIDQIDIFDILIVKYLSQSLN